ncbi:hypothetical protein FIBSPDRAFT_1042281 [Athelia psychrophila]|uniref:BTB domain-containing protein n=1 Tax=Athelia psychrophila TaxID=1759441 RepID=A0A166MQR1_9AGAM|nr:hypothetical protein FIBSPDRAFT_1042281 [Fibularhizoctonia sp. CBS 109695]
MSFGEKPSLTASIAAILDAYPFSVGLLREFLQNSDDATASEQIFVLDSRTHPNSKLFHPELAGTQGPALLACNDSLFEESDWEAVQRPNESSKMADTNKIGKYGVGFRACYHVTDNPQILSDSSLAIFDPHRKFTETGGERFDFVEKSPQYKDQLSGFDFFLKGDHTKPCRKTIIRLPLRTLAGAMSSRIRGEVVEPSKIRKIFQSFIEEELGIVLLFLNSVTSIKIYEVDDNGTTCRAEAKALKRHSDVSQELNAESISTYILDVKVTRGGRAECQSWRIFNASFPRSNAVKLLSKRLGYDVAIALEKQKLHPNVAFAVPLDLDYLKQNKGRLYIYLPLPLSTGFPCHVHALFALAPDRQHLRNSEETGIVGVDSVHVEWNRLLFDTFIPYAWASMLLVLLRKDDFIDVFQAWPPPQPEKQGGDAGYWKNLPCELIKTIVGKNLAVWPIIPYTSNPLFLGLRSLLVAEESDDKEMLAALAMAGVQVTQPSTYIKALLEKTGVAFTPLKPDTTRDTLLTNLVALSRMQSDASALKHISSYLLSTGNIGLLVGLPLVRQANGELTSLESYWSSKPNHVLLDGASLNVFRDCDKDAIDLTQVSPYEAELFLAGPMMVNVATLDVKRILRYLKCAFANFGFDIDGATTGALSEDLIRWLISFWEWLAAWDLRSRFQLYKLIGTLPLIPTSRNTLLPVAQGVMEDAPPNVPSVFEALDGLGMTFIHTGMSELARLPLEEQGLIKSVKNGVHILDQLPPSPVYVMRRKTAERLRTHMLTVLASSVRSNPLTAEHAQKLRALPMFPILAMRPDAAKAAITIGAIDGIAKIISVDETSLLPVIPNTAYVEGCNLLQDILPGIIKKNNVVTMLTLAVDHIGTQSKHLQCTILDYMVNHQDDITNRHKKMLAQAPFVTVGIPTSGELRAAEQLFDPDGAFASLFPKHDFHIPSTSGEEDKAIVDGLRTLKLFRKTLGKDVIEERITHLAQSYREEESRGLALKLMQSIMDHNIDVRDVSNLRNSKWLPVAEGSHTDGLCTSEECHHRDAHAAALFDQALPSLQVKHMTESFMVALEWRAPLNLNVIITQLDHVTKQGPSESSFKKLRVIINELGQRVDGLTGCDVERLRDFTSGRLWIPISKAFFSATGRAVFSSPGIMPRGFHKIPGTLSEDAGTRRFICLMGCTESPTVDALLEELHSLQHLAVSEDRTSAAIDLLTSLADMELVIENGLPTLIPTAEDALHAISTVYYNDLQRHAVSPMPRIPEGCYLAHPLMKYELAKQLQMTFLGHRETQFKALLKTSRDIGESLINRIKGVLLQYSLQQAFTEFITNAVDAGAKHFAIMIDDWSAPSIRVISPLFGQLQSHSSLIVYNDSVFSEDDFDGIMDLGRGGKGDRTDTIGQFGLGALTMFHFTDAAMIVSGKYVMFLDPSRMHLPIQNQVSARMSLSDVKLCYPDHLTSVDGLYGFSLDSDHFQGTLFRLPLRKTRSPLSEQPLSTSELHHLIKNDYWDIAAQTLMFANVELIEAHHRDKQGEKLDLWFVKTKRGPEAHQEGHFTTHSLNIDASSHREGEHGEWHIFTYETKDELPSEFQLLPTKYRLQHPIKIAFAAGPQPSPSQGRFFATMPLPGASGLPVHFHAPFILTPDRRSTRVDDMEAKYNAWLLGTLAPPLYVYLLERLFHQRPNQLKDRWLWWPLINPMDPLTSSLYATHLSKTSRAICVSTTSEIISPSQATFFVDATLAEVRLLRFIDTSNLVEIPAAIQAAFGSSIRSLDPTFVKNAISTDAEKVKASFAGKTKQYMTVQDIQDVVRFLCTEKDMTLQGLPLLPLANSTLAAFQDALDYAPYSTPYYAWDSFSEAHSLFPSHRMVHPDFSIIKLGKSYNVSRLDGVAVQSLVSDRVKQSETLENCDEDYGVWVTSFWQGYKRMKIDEEDIATFPLVITTTPSSYVSLKKCKTNTVLVLAATQLRSILECLGVTAIALELCPPALQDILKSDIYNATVWNVVRFFQSMPASSIASRFTILNAGDRAFLAGWLTTRLIKPLPDNLKDTASHLPIWALLGDANGFVAASRANMLSSDATIFSADILHFSPAPLKQRLVAYSATLSYIFSKMGLTKQRLWSELGLTENRVLQPLDMAPYCRTLVAVLESNQWDPNASLVVPDGHNMLVKVRDLYSRSQPLFRSTFETFPDKLVHQDILDLEPRLRSYGLHMDMNFASFLVCVSTIHNEAPDSARRIERAAGLYRWYSETFPVQAEEQQWSQLNHFRFVPATASQRAAPYPSAYLNDNTRDRDLVSPQEVLLPVHEAIAWTQKVLFNPSDRLTIANQLIGVPTPIEVYMHLRVLALQIAPNYPPTPQLISDIRDTYNYLDKHTGDAEFRGALATHRNDALFLNVDNAKVGSWTWRSAAELYICTGLIKDIPNNNYWVVRKFLNNFSNLLGLAQVGEIKAAKAQAMPNSASKAELDSIVGAFNDMRVKTELTDVAFVAGDDDSEDRMQFHGHRDFLVSRSQFFHGLFCGSFEEAKPANEPFIVEDCGVDCLREILDYLYTWKIPEAEDEDALLEILKLADYWNIPILFEAMQIRIINLGLISVDTYSTLREKADLYHAVILQEACKVFETENMHEIKMFHDRRIVI